MPGFRLSSHRAPSEAIDETESDFTHPTFQVVLEKNNINLKNRVSPKEKKK